MIAKLSESVAGKLAEKWVADVLTPAFAFWFIGGLAVVQREGWPEVAGWFTAYSQPVQLAIMLLAFLVVATSAELVGRLDHATVRILEGYWPGWLNGLRRRLVDRRSRGIVTAEQDFQTLQEIQLQQAASGEQLEALVTLDRALRRVPARVEERMPTALGDRLRAAERWARDKYGLDAVICWPRLWLLLPESTRSEIAAARHGLDVAARVWLWSLLFAVWTPWAWWAAALALVGMILSYRWMLDEAETYGDLVESAFDLYRTNLYHALRWPLPRRPASERDAGEALTGYLWRGSDQPHPLFTPDQK